MNNKLELWSQSDLKLDNLKKCAIFVHYIINDYERIEKKKNKLIQFCEDILKTSNYEIFIKISSFLGRREVFNNMLKRFERGEFSHLVVTNIEQIFRFKYNPTKAQYLISKIQRMNVMTICVEDGQYINVLN